MIHPSTMAGPNWFTGSFGTNNPFQQNNNPFFRNTPFQGPQGGFGFNNNPFQNTSFGFGTNPTQFQTAINELVRQTVPTLLTNPSFQPTNGFQTPFGNWNPSGFQAPNPNWSFGTQFQNRLFTNTPAFTDWQTQSFVSELIRQTTNQALQNFPQFNTGGSFPGTTWPNNPNFGFNPQQQNIWNICAQLCQQACEWVCLTTCQAIFTCAIECLNQQNTPFNTSDPFNALRQQNIWNTCAQLCQQACLQLCQTVTQSLITCAITCLNTPNTSFNFNTQNTPFTLNTPNTPFNFSTPNTPFNFNTPNTPFNFNTQSTPFNFNNSAPQFSFTPGIPTGVGAF